MKKENKYQQILNKLERRNHLKDTIKDYMESKDKGVFIKEHGYTFVSSALYNQLYLMPNMELTQLFNTSLTTSATYCSGSSSFTVPYKITFRVSNVFTSNFNALIFIRDSLSTTGANITPFPDPSFGNQFIFGTGAGPRIITQTSGGVVVDNSLITPQFSDGLITVKELTNNAIQINYFDGINSNSQAYTSVTGVFATTIRNIALHTGKLAAGSQLICSYQIAPTVSW